MPAHASVPRYSSQVLLFGDDRAALYELERQRAAYRAWRARVARELSADGRKRCVILEVGAGTAVPSVRDQAEGLLQQLGARQCTLVRINPVPVTGDNSAVRKQPAHLGDESRGERKVWSPADICVRAHENLPRHEFIRFC